MTFLKDRDEPIYTISIAAKLVRPAGRSGPASDGKPIHAQTLRMYDKLGLVRPRKVGKNRFYSDRDIERLQQIQHFTQEVGINLAGVGYIFALMEQLQQWNTPSERMDAMLREAEQRVREMMKDEE
jgi:MerR family transcriptional regulator/heat shock protein HspR